MASNAASPRRWTRRKRRAICQSGIVSGLPMLFIFCAEFAGVWAVTFSCHTWLLFMSFHEFIWSRTRGKMLSHEGAKYVDTVGVTGLNPVSRKDLRRNS